MVKIILDSERCTLCQYCINICPMGVYEHEDKVEIVKKDQCILCRACEAACFVEAIVIEE